MEIKDDQEEMQAALSGDVSLKVWVSEGNSRGTENWGGSNARIKYVLGKRRNGIVEMPVKRMEENQCSDERCKQASFN